MSDLFRKASNGSTRPVATNLDADMANGATSATLAVTTGWNEDTGSGTDVDVIIYSIDVDGNKVDGTQTDWVASLSGDTLSSMELQAGTMPASGYPAGALTVVIASPTAAWADDLVTGILLHADQDGSLKTAAVQEALGLGADDLNGWNALGYTPNTVTCNGNRSYDLVVNSQDLTSTLSAGMRIRTQRTVAAPTQCTSLNGTTQYWSKSSPNKMTFTDDFVAGGWYKWTDDGTVQILQSRWNGTSGWVLQTNANGQVELIGYNAGGANYSLVRSTQSLISGKWIHVAAQLDMSAFTATTTTSYVMLDGLDVPATVVRGGTNPTALVQAGDFQVGAGAGANFLLGKVAQSFLFSAKVTQATLRGYMNQGLAGTETNLASAYSFNNAITDLNTTTPNDLTAAGSAVATNADSPFGGQASGSISSTLDYAIIQKVVFSTDTTITVQVAEGCTIPTGGGVLAVTYSSNKAPYGMPVQPAKWTIEAYYKAGMSSTSFADATWIQITGHQINAPVGCWEEQHSVHFGFTVGGSSAAQHAVTLSTANNSESDPRFTTNFIQRDSNPTFAAMHQLNDEQLEPATATTYYLNGRQAAGGAANCYAQYGKLKLRNAYL